MERSPRLEGKEWQLWATQLLHRRYPPGEYQEIPDTVGGDAGIEGYSMDGCAYQMYGPERDLTPEQQYSKLRSKMNTDIKKFINNKEKLARLLGTTKIRRWILLVPSFHDRAIVEYAKKKTEEVLQAGLPYVEANDFQVTVLSESAFAVEREQLLTLPITTIEVNPVAISEHDVDEWTAAMENSELISVLDDKLRRMPTLRNDSTRQQFRHDMVKHFLQGQNILDALREYPDIYEAVRCIKSQRENYLWTECMSCDEVAGRILMRAINQIQQEVKSRCPALSQGNVDAIAWEAAADWLMRCPLDFPEATHDE